MRVNVVITPKKQEVIECTDVMQDDGGNVILYIAKGTGRNRKLTPIAGFKKWIRFYILPEEKSVKKDHVPKYSLHQKIQKEAK